MLVFALLCLGSFTFSLGCRGGDPKAAAANRSHLAEIAKLYARFLGANQGQLPRDEAQLREFIGEAGGTYLENSGITDVDSLFVSERDNQPYVLLLGAEGEKNAGTGVVGYEQTGVDGKRLVAYRFGSVEELDPDRFQRLMPKSK